VSEYQKTEDADSFWESTIKIYLKVLKKNPSIPESLMQVIAWIMGEFASTIPDEEKIMNIMDELCNQAYLEYDSHITMGMIVSAIGKLHLQMNFTPIPCADQVMLDFCNSKHINV
jgi:uncharacterized protein YneF (UPF0154 family)